MFHSKRWTFVVPVLALIACSASAQKIVPSPLLAIDQNRSTVVERIVNQWGDSLAASNAGITASHLREILTGLRSDHLLAASLAGSVEGLRDVVSGALVHGDSVVSPGLIQAKSLGDTNDDLVYTPLVPCRILDTRYGTVPPYNAVMVGGSAFPVAANLSNFAPQGGSTTNCNLPSSFQAIAVTFTVLNPNYDAFLAASNTSDFATLTQSVVMDFSANKGLANTAIVPLAVLPLPPGTVKFYLGLPALVTTNVIADVLGYFNRPANYLGTHDISGLGATDGGGYNNISNAGYSTVGGGFQNTAGGNASTIGGGSSNTVTGAGSTVAGGLGNTVTGTASAIGGGQGNQAFGDNSVVGGGFQNHANASDGSAGYMTIGGGANNYATVFSSTVGGGNGNTAHALYSTIGGGLDNGTGGAYSTVAGGHNNGAGAGDGSAVAGGEANNASGLDSTVAGGFGNTASGTFSTVPGGKWNTASGNYSFAAGYRALTQTAGNTPIVHDGTFVFADSSNFNFYTAAPNEFSARATGGVRFVLGIDGTTGLPTWTCAASNGNSWACSSDRNLKENFQRVDGMSVLQRLSELPLYFWNAKGTDPNVRHMGPTAQDFMAAFALGNSDKMIGMQDADGVALAAIQGLHQIVQEKDREIALLKARGDALERDLVAIKAKLGM